MFVDVCDIGVPFCVYTMYADKMILIVILVTGIKLIKFFFFFFLGGGIYSNFKFYCLYLFIFIYLFFSAKFARMLSVGPNLTFSTGR